ncbi:hypothetical protein [Streptomyces sp. NPDC093060]|uniref:hypothetical protein n=1 Tax=Streptomyces sp. NPDC093060 TaxID=3366019 RepID=UPI0038102007
MASVEIEPVGDELLIATVAYDVHDAVVDGIVEVVAGGVVGCGIGTGMVRGVQEAFQMKFWLEGLFRKERSLTTDETSPEHAAESQEEISPEERAALLVAILDDPTAREDEKSDAAMDLEFHSDPFVETCLIRIIRAEDFTSVLAQQCAESLGGIWARTGRVDPAFMTELRGAAKDEVFGILGIRAPHLLLPS